MAHRGLGRGLDALLGDYTREEPPTRASVAPSASDIVHLDPALLLANPSQPRTHFDEEALEELSASIKEYGVLQPIIAERLEGGEYRIVAGERRTRAAVLAGQKEVPVIVKSFDEVKRLEVALIENIQRADLNPIEEAAAYQHLMDMGEVSQEALAERIGKKRSTVANAMRLLSLSDEMKAALKDGRISAGHGRALLSVPAGGERDALFRRILDEGLTVRQAEDAAARAGAAHKKDGGRRPSSGTGQHTRGDANITALEQTLLEKLGTKCRINGTMQKGRIEIDYYSMDDLDKLCALLGAEG